MANLLRILLLASLTLVLALSPAPAAESIFDADEPDHAEDASPRPAKPAIVPPADKALAAARQKVRSVFKSDLSGDAEARREVAAKLLEQSDAEADSDLSFAMLLESIDVAIDAGDPVLALDALDVVTERFSVDARAMQTDTLARIARKSMPPTLADHVARIALTYVTAAEAADDYAAAIELCSSIESLVSRSGSKSVAGEVRATLKELRAIRGEYERVKDARRKLEKNPDDGAAHLAVGRFLAFRKGKWAAAAQHLARSSDPTLADLGRREQQAAGTLDPQTQLAMGDAWFDAAEKSSGRNREFYQSRARDWYTAALPALSGLSESHVAKRLEAIQKSIGGPTNKIDLLARADLDRDVMNGQCERTRAGITVTANNRHAQLTLRYIPPEEYDYIIEFTRVEGETSVGQICSANGRNFYFVMGTRDGRVFGIGRIRRMGARDDRNPTRVIMRRGLENGRRYRAVVSIRKGGVAITLDGRPLVQFATDFKDMDAGDWAPRIRAALGIGCEPNNCVIFHRAEVVEISGKGKILD